MVNATTDYPLAYLITFRTYGTWLHGDERGSVDRANNHYEAPLLAEDAVRQQSGRQRLKAEPYRLGREQRHAIHRAILEVCQHRGWELLALNVRTNHVHAVVASTESPERLMNDFKAWGTRRLREERLVGPTEKVWARHGSTRYLWTEQALEDAREYVVNGQ